MNTATMFWIISLAIILTTTAENIEDVCNDNGMTRRESSVWKRDSCTQCTCNGGVISCNKIQCKDPGCDADKGEFMFLPMNDCCPQCTTDNRLSCIYNDKIIAHNIQWEENCTLCTCSDGNVLCEDKSCPELNCGYGETLWRPPGECCSKCASLTDTCTYNNHTYRDGEIWSPSDCLRAKCNRGEVELLVAQCDPITCAPSQTRTVKKGQCCPTCKGATCSHEGQIYTSGQQFTTDSCTQCVCRDGDIKCYTVKCEADGFDGVQCPAGTEPITREGECCPKCVSTTKTCHSDGVTKYDGELWSSGICTRCSCKAGIVHCFDLQCSKVTCRMEGYCCPECVPIQSYCNQGSLTYRHGDEWQTGSCEQCHCRDGIAQCFKAQCTQCPEHTVAVRIQDECCPVCEPINCNSDCETCFGKEYGKCLTCKDSRHLLQEGKCVRRCQHGYYQVDEYTCKACDSSCKTCGEGSRGSCTSCQPPMLLQDNVCVDDCTHGFYEYDGRCLECHETCSRCFSASFCVSCVDRTHLIQGNKCVQECTQDHFLNNSRCMPCHVSCATCTSHHQCKTCPEGKLMEGAFCVSFCSENFYQDGKVCYECDGSCGTCSGKGFDNCESCKSDNVLFRGKCVSSCPPGTFEENKQCYECDSTCRSCVGKSLDQCLYCSSAFHVVLPKTKGRLFGSCVSRCLQSQYLSGKTCKDCDDSCLTCTGPSIIECTSCKPNMVLLQTSDFGVKCISLGECYSLNFEVYDKYCIPLNGLSQCNEVEKSLYWNSSTGFSSSKHCIATCPGGTFQAMTDRGGICTSCGSKCKACQSSTRCTACDEGFLLSLLTNQCVPTCESGFYQEIPGKCRACPANCASCEKSISFGQPHCTSCREKSAVLQFGECIQQCPSQFYSSYQENELGTYSCKQCPWSALKCSSPEHSSKCVPGYFLHRQSCVNECGEEYYTTDTTCVRCTQENCRNCTSQKCLACKQNFILHGGACVSSCPSKYVEDQNSNCVPCSNNCLSCTLDGTCTQCNRTTYMQPQEGDLLGEGNRRRSTRVCKKTCPRGFHKNILRRICEVDQQIPLLHANKPIVVPVGGRFLISDDIVRVSDGDSDYEHLSILVTMSPANGWLEMGREKLQTGSQIPVKYIRDEKLWYVHDASSNQPNGVLSVRAYDRYLKSQSRNIDIIVVSSEEPVILKNDVMQLRLRETASIAPFFNVYDADNEQDLTITITSQPQKGVIQDISSIKQIREFTVDALRRQLIAYTPNNVANPHSNSTVNDQINFQVSDGYNVLNVAFRIIVLPMTQHKKTSVRVTSGHVRTRGLLHLSSKHLQILAPGVKDKSKLVYKLTPVNYTSGEVVKILPMSSDAPMEIDMWNETEKDFYRSRPLLKFSQKEVDDGNMWYRDLGGHGDIEAFTFQVLDESEFPPVEIAKDVFHVTVVPENSEAPRIARGVKLPLQMLAEQDSVNIIHNGYMRFTDDDTPDRDLIYNITRSLPVNYGTIEHADNPYVPITVFTQSDVDSNKIMYRPSFHHEIEEDVLTSEILYDEYDQDSEQIDYDSGLGEYGDMDEYDLGSLEAFEMTLREAPPDDISFEFTVSDGQHTVPANHFTIKLITGTSAAPTFRNSNPKLSVTQGGTSPIGEQQLAVDDPDTLQNDLSFTLVKGPRHGSIVRNDQGTRVIMSEGEAFLYNQIQRNALQYIHDGSYDYDSDQFQVSVTDITHTATKVIQITILPTNGAGPTPDPATELSLVTLESSIVTLTRENLAYVDGDSSDYQIEYHVEEGPRYGVLDSDVVEDIESFTQQDINDGLIQYRSEGRVGSNPRTDILQFSVSDSHGNKLPNQILTITVTPGINQIPVVSVGEGLTVEEGGRVLLTPRNIIVTDADTPSSEIVITITTNPKFGYFLNNIRPDSFNIEEETWFTMQDVLDGGIYYIQSLHHKMEPDKDYFHIRVSDGHSKTSYYRINVTIMPKNDEEPEMETHSVVCESGQAIMILNGSLTVKDPDTSNSNLEFEVTSLPQHGSLVKFKEKMTKDMLHQWQLSRTGQAEVDMQETKKISRLRIGSRFTYQDILDGLVWFESAGFVASTQSKTRRRRDALGFVLRDGKFEKQGSIEINVSNKRQNEFDGFDELDNEDDRTHPSTQVVNILTPVVPVVDINTGIETERGSITVITSHNLRSTADGRYSTYIITKHPEVGALELSKGKFKINLTASGEREFTQQDIDEGLIRYVHSHHERGGRFYFRFNVMGESGNSLTGQNFEIVVLQDTVPPSIITNTGLVVKEGASQKLTAQKLSATDDKSRRLTYTITRQPTLGRVEYIRQSGRPVTSFTQGDVTSGLVQYVHTSSQEETEDSFTFSLSDGTNSIVQSFAITVVPVDNSIPLLENHGIRVQEGVRKTVTQFDLKATDQDTATDRISFTILQGPLHGSVEKTTNNGRRYIPVKTFTMEDIYESRITYSHDGSNSIDDRFSFVVSDGTNSEFSFIEEGEIITTTSAQTFNIEVLPVDDGTPRLVTNHGITHLENMDNQALGTITKKILLTEDPDTSDDMIIYTVTSEPRHGYLESKMEIGTKISSFSQADINTNSIRYVLNEDSVNEVADSFMFNVRDSMPNVVTGNLFYIRWSVISFEKASYRVKEGIGQIDIPVRRQGNLNQYAIVLCQTRSGSATSKGQNPDFVEHAAQVQFDEHQGEKTCSIHINDDTVFESDEYFNVELTLPNYALLGDIISTQVHINDNADMPSMSFVESEFVVEENAKFAFIPIKRSGDITKPITIVCFTEAGTATESGDLLASGSDFTIRRRESTQSVVSFSAGATTATCDIRLIDDSVYEEDEFFTVKLSDPSGGSRIGEIDAATVTISGPNDAASVFFSDYKYEFAENSGTVDIPVMRTGSDLTHTVDVWCATRSSEPSSALPGEDFVQTSTKVTFRNGETTKLCSLTILDDTQFPSVEGNETFEVYLTSVLRAKLVTPSQATVIINDTLDDVPTMEFIETEVDVKESDRTISLAIKRDGDIRSESSVICSTRAITADADDDFTERSVTETSRILFQSGQKIAYCNITIIDDNVYEAIEKFSVHLSSTSSDKWYGARVGRSNSVTVTISNAEDAPTIQFERVEYSIREPDASEETKQLVIHVIRTGDTSEISKVRCSTRDGSATSGSDYEPKSRMIRFAPGDTRATFKINILPTDDTEWHETFLVVLGPDEPVNAVLGTISTVTVTVLDKDAAGSLVLPTTPVVVSLLHYDDVAAGLDTSPSPGYPLICVTPCDPHYPDYVDTRNLCEQAGINSSAIKFSWEVATPTSVAGGNPPFERVKDNTPFTRVDRMVLDSIYFSRRFHVRCVAQAVDSITQVAGIPLRSNVATISTSSGLCHNPIVAGSERGFQAQSFIAKLAYNPPESEENPNTLKVSVEIPHQDGRLPIISTMPLNNLKFLSRPIVRQQHLCSNLMYSSNPVEIKGEAEDKIGSFLGFIEPTDYSKLSLSQGFDKPYQLDPKVRGGQTIDLYKYLNLKSCSWKFETHYQMNELVDFCNGKEISDYQLRDIAKTRVTVIVPLYVSYVYVTAPTGWGSLEHSTDMEFSFDYDNVHWRRGVLTDSELKVNIVLTKASTSKDGRLVIEFDTHINFRGMFVLEHHTQPERISQVLAPANFDIKFDLILLSTQHTFDAPTQTWRATSTYSRKDYSGEYRVLLIPCTVGPKQKWTETSPDQEVSCTASTPKGYPLVITFGQTNRPVPVIYSLDTEFQLSNNGKLFAMDPTKSTDKSEQDYTGSFSKGQTIYGRVLWNPQQNLNSAYRLRLEKVYLCTGKDAYVPYFDPTGERGNGPQYGCIQPGKNLQHRFLLLDRDNPEIQDHYFHDVPFDAHFASDHSDFDALSDLPGVDGFLMKVDALYTVKAGHEWFLQVLFEIGSDELLRSGRARRAAVMTAVGDRHRRRRSAGDYLPPASQDSKNGTNMKSLTLDLSQFDSGLPVSMILLVVGIAIVLVCLLCLCVCCCFVKRPKKEVGKQVDESEMEEICTPLNAHAVNVKVVSLPKKDNGDNKLEKNYFRSQRKQDVNYVTPPSKSDRRNNENQLRPLLATQPKRKNITIVNNLKHNREEQTVDDGTEV